MASATSSAVPVVLGHGGGLETGGGRTEARLTESSFQRLQFNAWAVSVPLSLSISHLCRSSLEEAAALDTVSCSGPLSSPPVSAVASLGSSPSVASSWLLVLTVSFQNSQGVVVYYSSCWVTYYCLLRCIYSFPRNPGDYISFLLTFKIENVKFLKEFL